MKSIYLYVIVIICCVSCSKRNNNILISEEKIYPSDKDSSTYLLTTFYENGSIKTHGWIKKFQKQGLWTEWYADGQISKYGDFNNGVLSLEFRDDNPEIILLDPLKVGKKCRVRIIGSWNKDVPITAGRELIDVEYPNDNSVFDLTITPLNKDTVEFWGIKIDTSYIVQKGLEHKDLVEKLNLTDEVLKNIDIDIIVKKEIPIKTVAVSD